MSKIKNMILGGAAFACIALAGLGVSGLQSAAKTASAETEITYTTVDTAMFVKFSDNASQEGRFNLHIVLPELDFTGASNGYYSFGENKDLYAIFDGFGFFDNVLIGEKTLKEWGCTSFFSNTIGLNEGEPLNQITFRCQADSALWNAALENGEVVIPAYDQATGMMSDGSKVTVKEGALVPGFMYLSGQADSTVYRASATYVGAPSQYSYSWYTVGQTDIDALQYTTGWDETYNNAYLGVSLAGDDYLGSGEEEVINENCQHAFSSNSNLFVNSILVNGEEEHVRFYGVFNLGEQGKGYYSFVIDVPQEECVSITIPKGTLFPARALNDLRKINVAFANVWYETQSDKTFYMVNGKFITYSEYKIAEITNYKSEEGYFRAEEEAQRLAIVEEVASAIEAAATESDVDAIFAQATADIDALKTAAQYADEELATDKAAATSEIQNYLSDVAYFEEQNALKTAAIEAGLAAIAAAKNVEEITQAVTEAKAAMDGIPTKTAIVDAAKAELDAYKADVEYRAQEAAARETEIATAKTAIDNATTEAAVQEAVAAAKTAIDELKSAAELTDEAFESKRQEANDAVNAEKAKVNFDLYTSENQAKINELYKTAKSGIADATTQAELDKAVQDFREKLWALPTSKPQEDEQPASSCQASLGGIGALCGAIAMLGLAVVAKRKEN